jgi:hypothetical protein
VPARFPAIAVVLAIALAACKAAGSPSQVATATPTVAATPVPSPTGKPDVAPRPSDLPTDGTCETGHSCLGLLKAGTTYRTKAFAPQVTFTMPFDGWENIADEGGIFQLLRLSAPGDIIGFFRNPAAATPDGKFASGVGSGANELATWLAANDQFQVTPAKPVTVGGLKGLQMDVRLADDATATGPPDCPTATCAAVLLGEDPSSSPTWEWDWGLAGVERMRVYLLTSKLGTIAIIVDSVDGTTFDATSQAADKILPSVKFS